MFPHHRTYLEIGRVTPLFELPLRHGAGQYIYRLPISGAFYVSPMWSSEKARDCLRETSLAFFSFLGGGLSQVLALPVSLYRYQSENKTQVRNQTRPLQCPLFFQNLSHLIL
jgi:hypothetical protein